MFGFICPTMQSFINNAKFIRDTYFLDLDDSSGFDFINSQLVSMSKRFSRRQATR